MDIEGKKIVFYDGECGFCNRSIAFVLKKDKSKSILFASIQSDFTTSLFQNNNWDEPDLSTFYLYEKDGLYQKSNAALRVARNFKFPYSLLQSFWIVPRFIRDGVYNSVAKHRKKISKGYCYVPNSLEKELFID